MARSKEYSIKAVIGAVDRITAPTRRIFAKIHHAAARTSRAIAGVGKIGAIAGAGIGGAAYGVWRLTNSWAKGADELSKFSRQTGFGIEALQEWKFVAARVGIESETLTGSIEKLTRNMGDAQMKTGTLYAMLSKYSAKSKEGQFLKSLTAAKDPSAAFDIMVEGLDRIKDPAKRATLAIAAFGRGGARMVRIVDEGLPGIAKLREQVRGYGLISKKTGKQAEDFMDSQENLDAALQGLKTTIGTQLMPVLQPYIESLTKWIGSNKELVGIKVGEIIKEISTSIPDALTAIGLMTKALGGLIKITAKVAQGWGLLIDVFSFSNEPLANTPEQEKEIARNKKFLSDRVAKKKKARETKMIPTMGEAFTAKELTMAGITAPLAGMPGASGNVTGSMVVKVEAAPGTTATVKQVKSSSKDFKLYGLNTGRRPAMAQ